MKIRFLSLLLCLSLLLGATAFWMQSALAATDNQIAAADTLFALGLFQGTGSDASGRPIYDLDRTPTRNEAVTMLVRLLGKEAEARAGTWRTPFTDVARWAQPYVGYAYENGLTNGTGKSTFSGDQSATAQQYLTFLLRALGYSEKAGDFQYQNAAAKASELGFAAPNVGSGGFTRGDCATLSLNALLTAKKGGVQTLGAALIEAGAIDKAAAEAVKLNSLSRDTWITADVDGSSWHFVIDLHNDTNKPLTLERLVVEHLMDGALRGDVFVHEKDRLPQIQLGFGTLQPGESYRYEDWHPIVDWFNQATYTFHFSDGAGGTMVQAYRYTLPDKPPLPDLSGDHGKDLETLRHGASFDVPVADGVYWVPVNTLGASRYTNAQVYGQLSAAPEEKAAAASTLYEALQFYQVGGFYSSDDNIRITEGHINWEHHKPGYDAVRTNNGCCATSANWLHYMLQGDYEEVGYVATSQRDGSGHIYNYIYEDGWYYFIDLTHYRTDWVATAVESGRLDDYYRSDYILGNLHRTRDVQSFVNYVQSDFNDPPGLMFQYTADNCLAIDGVRSNSGVVITYEDRPSVKVNVIFDDPGDSLTCDFVAPPKNLPDWSAEKSYDFPQ